MARAFKRVTSEIQSRLVSLGLPSFSKLIAICATVSTSAIAQAQLTEHFDHQTFAAAASNITIINFDALSPCNTCLTGNEFISQGLTIVQSQGGPINVVRNLVPGGYGANYVTEANINSIPNGISSSIQTNTADQSADDFEFVFANSTTAAGLFIGNLGGSNPLGATFVEFLDESGVPIASEAINKDHTGVIFGSTGQTWDCRVFYGISGAASIRSIRIGNGTSDGDGIVIDDIQFGLTQTTCIPSDVVQSPTSTAVAFGGAAQLTVTATGSGPLTYQWRKGGVNLSDGPVGCGGTVSGATTDTLVLSTVTFVEGGNYDCVVTNTCGSDTSTAATLTVNPPPAAADINHDGQVNGLDIQALVDAMISP